MKFKLDALVHLYLRENFDEKKKELPTCSKDLDNLTYSLFKKPGRYTSPLHLIHTNVWTSPIFSNSGFKYYVIFVDDCSRYTWLYPLQTKAKVYECFIEFELLVEKQFSSSIKQLQSDGEGKYTSIRFQSFLTKNSILHRKSCLSTSQQNGLAERKRRHILEIGLTLLAHSYLSNTYWVDAFLITPPNLHIASVMNDSIQWSGHQHCVIGPSGQR
jgi:transposase InsO family protein